MKSKRIPAVVTMAVVLAVLGGSAVTAQDKYAVQVPDGLAFSEFRGYETWQVVSVSKTHETVQRDRRQSRDNRRNRIATATLVEEFGRSHQTIVMPAVYSV